LRKLLPLLERKQDRSWREKIEGNVKEWWEVLKNRAMNDANPINPQRVFWELSPRLPEKCIIACDTGSGTNWYARDIKIRRGMMASVSGSLATMGPGMPYAIAAKFAYPDRPVLALCGDGALQMNGMNELITVAKYWKKWSDPRLIVLALNNRDLNQVTWEMRAQAGNPKFEATQDLPDVRYSQFAEQLGLKGVFVDKPDQIGAAWEAAFASDRPFVLEAYTDPDVPPLPPHITLKQAQAFGSTLIKGDPSEWRVIKETAKEVLADLLPSRS
jgi:pyruvate dehydrogenase (quinone)